MTETPPFTGFKGIIHHWKEDVSAAVSVSLVALPLALGIALASGAPAMSGILAAIIGGVVTTFFRGSYVAINGPAAGLIVVVLTGVQTLGDENGSGFPYVLAAIVVAGVIQALLGLLKLGKLGDLFPASVVNGMLATIGIIIFVKQFHVALGVEVNSGSSLVALLEIPNSILKLNPFVTIISVVSLAILIIHPMIRNKVLKSIPAPLQVLIVAIPMVFLLNLFGDPSTKAFGYPVYIEAKYLINIPENLSDVIIFPNFSKMMLPQFWLVVLSITLVASIETLISTKAVDKLDHYKRRTDLNKDLFAVGLSSAVAGFLGGLPIITVIVRSSVNVHHNAKTKWSNLYHGLILLLLVFLFPFIIREIPQACLAAILVYTGYKLASPRVFKATLLKGWEQLLILIATIFASLAIDLLWGIVIGIITTLIIHWIRSQLNIRTFIRHLINTEINVVEESKNVVHVDIKGIANFAIMLKLINSLKGLGNQQNYIVNFSRTKLVDSTVLDFIHEHREKYFTQTDFEFIGLDVHKTSSAHPLALHVLERPMPRRLTSRQNDILHFAMEKQYRFHPGINWDLDYFEKFRFLEYHLIEYHRNRLIGSFKGDIHWLISDLTYNDGILMAREEHHITLMILFFPEEITPFSITKENTRQLKTLIRNENQTSELPTHLNDLGSLLSNNASYYIEGVDRKVLIYRKERLLSSKEIMSMHNFAKKFCEAKLKANGSVAELQSYLK
ncbi:SulP family inorganic anion transporter [Fulvivirgaceae bacterium BMA10]|uniref:SulP family inorganic anion transporter n=1 Tax=Splendidivirga corallicola TaxID=3051826 RepID=A0ABT8KMI6_9BACT|nr:SulP family inorganic anion transporter [Fulvivirgaceae bacterium BMA10]